MSISPERIFGLWSCPQVLGSKRRSAGTFPSSTRVSPRTESRRRLYNAQKLDVPPTVQIGLVLASGQAHWPAPGSEDTELGVLMEQEVGHGEAEVYARVQA